MQMDELREMLLQLLHERFPVDIPAFIKDRFDTEWEYLTWDTWIDDMDHILFLYYAIVKAAEAARQPVWNCNFGSGSFLFYLLDKGLNPLEPHWQCRKCGHIETDDQAELCFDLPIRDCPDCRTSMVRDGIHGSAEEALRRDGLEIRVNEDFLDAATEAALAALKDYNVFQRRWNDAPGPENRRSYYYTDQVVKMDRLVIHLDESGIEYINVEDKENFKSDFHSITIMEQTDVPMTKCPMSMEEWMESKPDIKALLHRHIQVMKERDLYYPENSDEQLLEMIDILQPDTWTALIELVCYAHGNYTWSGKTTTQEKVELIRNSGFRRVMYSRESLQFYLHKQGIPVILDHQMVEQLRKGRKGWEMELFGKDTPLLEKDELFNAVKYLWPRTHAINWLWRLCLNNEQNCGVI